MPNWCENVACVKHSDRSMLQKVVDGFNGKGLFSAFLPTPPELLKGNDWYDWRVNNWGTKWDVSKQSFPEIIVDGQINLTFDTAWSPPISFYEHLLTLGFEVDAYYYEGSMDFCGHWHNGEDAYYEGTDNVPENVDRMFNISERKEEDVYSEGEEDS